MNPHPRGVRLGHLSRTTAELFAKTENQQLEKGMQCLGQTAASQSIWDVKPETSVSMAFQ